MEFWHNRWESQNIGWHRQIYNDLLLKYWPTLNPSDNCSVLVPLCGKSLDMVWLAEHGHTVIGLEMVQQAVEAFYSENKLPHDVVRIGKHKKYSNQKVTIYQGDIFELKSGTIQADAWYDRAAMIAIEPSTRANYVNQIRKQTKLGAVGLLITFAYPQEQMEGPPFALHDGDVARLFSDGFELECLETINLEEEKYNDIDKVTSSVFKITRID